MKFVSVPGSKSVSNRALVLAAISNEPTVLSGVLECDDSRVLQNALTKFGVQFEKLGKGTLKIIPPQTLQGNNSENFIGNAGTSTRFLTALSLITEGSFSLRGVDRMHERPFKDLFEAIRALGVEITFEGKENFLPAKFQEKRKKEKWKGRNSVKVSGSISSQFLSGLLLVAPKMPQGLEICITDEIKSRPYVEMTLEVLKAWNVKVDVSEDFRIFTVHPGLRSPRNFSVPADSSSASYPILWSMLTGKPICIENYGEKTLQGDENFLDVVERSGGKVTRNEGAVEILPPEVLQPLGNIDFSLMPDVSMTAMVLASCAEGKSKFTGLESLRVKECDRIKAMQEGLEKLGVDITVEGDVVCINGCSPCGIPQSGSPDESGLFHGVNDNVLTMSIQTLNSFEDHRIAMVFGVLRVAKRLKFEITHQDCVSKSWPEFWLDLADWNNEMRQVSSLIVQKGEDLLIVKKPREHHAWQFPQGGTERGENGVETAQREFSEECGSDLHVQFDSEYPIGKYCYFFPKNFKRHREGIRGACVRFYEAKYISGEVQINLEELEDFKWVKRSELPNYFEGDYLEAVRKFL